MSELDNEPEESPDFESALSEVERIVKRLERGDVSLETALADFERGVTLIRQCTKSLNEMELRVEQLVVTTDGEILRESFEADTPLDEED